MTLALLGLFTELNDRFSYPYLYTSSTEIPTLYGQLFLSLGNESPYIFCKFNPLRDASLILTLFVAPSVSFLTGFD